MMRVPAAAHVGRLCVFCAMVSENTAVSSGFDSEPFCGTGGSLRVFAKRGKAGVSSLPCFARISLGFCKGLDRVFHGRLLLSRASVGVTLISL